MIPRWIVTYEPLLGPWLVCDLLTGTYLAIPDETTADNIRQYLEVSVP